MSDIFGTRVAIEVRINKKTGKYSVTITDNGEKMGCTEIDAEGNSLHAKIVEYVSTQMSGRESEEAKLTKEGEVETRSGNAHVNLTEDEEDEELVYDPMDDTSKADPYDVGGFGI